jgi:signal transduction histidine kinase
MRELAELSGGAFAVESVPGKGTTIRARWTT